MCHCEDTFCVFPVIYFVSSYVLGAILGRLAVPIPVRNPSDSESCWRSRILDSNLDRAQFWIWSPINVPLFMMINLIYLVTFSKE